ncbi:helix-turn-helix domain-containing protein [Streptomyces sp. S.PB5]|uniref:AraC-like ligand-binding domain-containing protein n=1 Tax=Streptomyces sp. S.PB5 TaxID=3020844 RepID=UPI0025AFF541|nr:helix-turn-helix domain-containing protein [Streptomyces sp. S.PB5]MDN3027203.1 helix-turn-helix domain-containing protein [Streptomyces sp. S.PB5]
MPVVLSTTPLSPAQRAECWHEAVSKTFIPLGVKLLEREPSVGTISSEQFGSLQTSVVRAGPQVVTRTPRLISKDREEWITVALQHSGTAVLEQDGREALLQPGDFAISDSGRPFRKTLTEEFGFTAIHLPRKDLRVAEQDLRAHTARVFSSSGNTSGLVATYLTRLAQGTGPSDGPVRRRLGLVATDLLALLIHERSEKLNPQSPDSAHAMLALIKEYIVRNLSDPGLSPESVAAAHRVSVRYLHKLFEHEDTTMSRWIQRHRLERCRRDLLQPTGMTSTVAAVALRWGFVSPSHFSRLFRATYGVSPREWQMAERIHQNPLGQRRGKAVPSPTDSYRRAEEAASV